MNESNEDRQIAMKEKRASMMNVRDISDYLYCERKAYLKTVMKLREPTSPLMMKGRLRHEILDELNKLEERIVKGILQPFSFEDLGDVYKLHLRTITTQVFLRNEREAAQADIDEEQFWLGLWKEMKRDVQLRIKAITALLSKNIFGEELWNRLEPKYLSEVRIASNSLGLVGRIDRLMISKEDNVVQYVPYEIKNTIVIRPYPSDIIQLTAYALLLETEFGIPVVKGVMEYRDKRIHVPITMDMKQEIHDIMKKIRNFPNEQMPKIIDNFKKCLNCGLKEQCYNL